MSDGLVWTMTYTTNNESIFIQDFQPEDNDGYMFFDQLNKLENISEEPTNRVAKTVTINSTVYTVANPQSVFSYRQPLA